MGGPDMGGLILYGACNGGPGIVGNVPNPAPRNAGFGRLCLVSTRHEIQSNIDRNLTGTQLGLRKTEIK